MSSVLHVYNVYIGIPPHQKGAGRINTVMAVLAEASKYFIIGKEPLCIHAGFSATQYHFRQKGFIKLQE